MKTNKTNLKSRIFAVMVSVMLLATCFMSTTAFAETPDETVQITKYLVMDKDANVPNVDFEFTIAVGEQTTVGEGQVVYAGVEGAKITDGATFTTESTTYETKQDGDTVTLTGEQKYAKDVVAVDFDDVNFTAPGLYHYVVTEKDKTYTGITEDTKTYDLYVLVAVDEAEDSVGGLYIAGATFSYMDGDTKLTGMTNTYTTHNITLSKTVTGNQGDRNKYFEFTVTINNAIDDTVYNVTGDFTTGKDLNGDKQDDNPTTLTATGGTVVQKYYLKDGQNIVINGVADGSTYSINEASYADDGYKTTDSGNTNGSIANADVSVTFTNNKQGTVPTGILLETAPYMILGAVVLAGIVVLFVTRRRRSH